jgi:hypothetical protein
MHTERFNHADESNWPLDLPSGHSRGTQGPDECAKQLEFLRNCSGNVNVSINSQKNANSSRNGNISGSVSISGRSRGGKFDRPIEELLEVHAQPNYQQFISGLPKNASAMAAVERGGSDVSTMLTSACDEKTDSISIQLTDGTCLSIDETYKTQMSLIIGGTRNQRNKQR